MGVVEQMRARFAPKVRRGERGFVVDGAASTSEPP
jgi:hypothetical protein